MSLVRRTGLAVRLWVKRDQDQRVEQAGAVTFVQVSSENLREPGESVKNSGRQPGPENSDVSGRLITGAGTITAGENRP